MYRYNFHDIFSLSTNIPYFEGLLHSFQSETDGRIRLRFLLDDTLKISTRGKPNVNLMLYYNARDDSVEFSYPWIAPIIAKLVSGDHTLDQTFVFNRNYLRFSNIIAEGWELIDVFRSLLQLSLIQIGVCMIHGAAVSIDERAVLIPSFGNTGKTTTAWMLARRGAGFVTDEFAILDSEGRCFEFPCSSLVSSALVKTAGLQLTRRQSLSLRMRNLRSKIFSTRFAPGGVKLYPDKILQLSDRNMIDRIVFIQNGIDEIRQVSAEEALTRLAAIRDYELGWRSNPYVIARSFFRPSFNPSEVSAREDEFVRSLVHRVRGVYLVSSSKQRHFEAIEQILREPPDSERTQPISWSESQLLTA